MPRPRRKRRCCCGETPCVLTRVCGGIASAKALRLVVGEVSGADPAADCNDCCDYLGGDHVLIRHEDVDMLVSVETSPSVFDLVWSGIGIFQPTDEEDEPVDDPDIHLVSGCVWVAIRLARPQDDYGLYPTRWGVSQAVCTDGSSALPCDVEDSVERVAVGPIGAHPLWWLGIQQKDIDSGGVPATHYRLVAVGSAWNLYYSGLVPYWTPVSYGLYASAWTTSPDYTVASTTLSLVTRANAGYSPATPTSPMPSPYKCSFPATVAVERFPECADNKYAGCTDPCGLSLDYDVLHFDGSIGGVSFDRTCLGKQIDESCGGYEYVAYLVEVASCPGLFFSFRLYCSDNAWWMDVSDGTTTVTLPASVDEFDQVLVSGTLTGICGDAVLVGAGQPCTDPAVFAGCCTDTEGCCVLQALTATGQATDTFGAGGCCPGTTTVLGLSFDAGPCGGATPPFDPADGYYVGDLPFDASSGNCPPFVGAKLLLACVGGSFQPYMCSGGSITSLSWDGAAPTGCTPTGIVFVAGAGSCVYKVGVTSA